MLHWKDTDTFRDINIKMTNFLNSEDGDLFPEIDQQLKNGILGLENVENTADIDKPISNALIEYLSEVDYVAKDILQEHILKVLKGSEQDESME